MINIFRSPELLQQWTRLEDPSGRGSPPSRKGGVLLFARYYFPLLRHFRSEFSSVSNGFSGVGV